MKKLILIQKKKQDLTLPLPARGRASLPRSGLQFRQVGKGVVLVIPLVIRHIPRRHIVLVDAVERIADPVKLERVRRRHVREVGGAGMAFLPRGPDSIHVAVMQEENRVIGR